MKKTVNIQDKNGRAGSVDGQYTKETCMCTEYFLPVYATFVIKYVDVVSMTPVELTAFLF